MNMSGRLDRQRLPGHYHKRKNKRLDRRGYATNPHTVWGDYSTLPGGITGPQASGCTAGGPGSFTPAGCDVPGSLAELTALGSLGQTAAWTTGQYVNLDPSGCAYWNGTAWAAGAAP